MKTNISKTLPFAKNFLFVINLNIYIYKLITNTNYLLNKCSIKYLLTLSVASLPFIMNEFHISNILHSFYQVIIEIDTGIIFIRYIYSVSK